MNPVQYSDTGTRLGMCVNVYKIYTHAHINTCEIV